MRVLVVVLGLAVSAAAVADDGVTKSAEPPRRHLVYFELLGKGGLYGVGYEYAIAPWLGLGGAVSYSDLRDQQLFTAAPYLHFTPLAGKRHALFSELGGILAHSHVPSPVMNWDGVSDTGGGGFASLGWEYHRKHLVLRTSGALVVGEGGLAPMLGFAIGARP
jgi:hypothetical protein